MQTPKIKLPWNKNFQACIRSWSLQRIPAYLWTRSVNFSYDKASFLFPRLHQLFSSLFLDSAFSSRINQDKCLGNIVGQCLAETGNGSLRSDTDMYFVWLGEFFFTVLTLITVSDIYIRSVISIYKPQLQNFWISFAKQTHST